MMSAAEIWLTFVTMIKHAMSHVCGCMSSGMWYPCMLRADILCLQFAPWQ